MKQLFKLNYLLLSCLLLISTWAFAAASPTTMLQSVSDNILTSLAQTKDRSDQALYSLVKQTLIPHIDLNQMSEMILGKNWATATPSQRADFAEEFTHFVTRTYSNALSSYNNQRVRFLPIRGGVSGSRTQVNSLIEQQDGQSTAVSYRLQLTNGEWKIYDFSVEGVSIVENYRSQFAAVLRNSGLTALIQQLKQQNQG